MSPEILPCLDHGMAGSAEWHQVEEQKASCLDNLEGNKPRWCDRLWLPQLALSIRPEEGKITQVEKNTTAAF